MCGCQDEDISLKRTISKGVASIPRVVRQVVNGQFVDPKTKSERMEICMACENYYAETKRCTVCTCYLDKKTVLACEECPLKKWLKAGDCP